LIVGTSAGALNGVALAADPTLEGARRIADGWRKVRRTDIFPGNRLTAGWRILTRRGSLHGHENFQRFVRTTLPAGVERFGDLRTPCIVTATVLGTARLRIFGLDPRERLTDAILASTAIPPFFPPYRYQDEWLVDGAVVANLPLAQAIGRGARTIYALNIVDEDAPASGSNLGQTLAYALSAMITRQDEQERRIAALGRQRGITIHDIKIPTGQRLPYNDFSSSAALIEAGYQLAAAYLDQRMAPQASRYRRLTMLLRDMLRTLSTRRTSAAPPSA
jgi:NTE family protein